MKSIPEPKIDISPDELIAEVISQLYTASVLKFDLQRHNIYQDKSGNTIGCGCIYCITLNRYANLKKLIHRINKRLLDDNYIYVNKKQEEADYNYLKTLKSICTTTKEQKNNLIKQLKL